MKDNMIIELLGVVEEQHKLIKILISEREETENTEEMNNFLDSITQKIKIIRDNSEWLTR